MRGVGPVRGFWAVGVAVLVAGLMASEARATCMEMARFRAVMPDCSVLQEVQEGTLSEVWPASRPIALSVETGACCSAPGGPVGCTYQPADASAVTTDVSLIGWDGQAASQVAGEFRVKRSKCPGGSVLVFDRPVSPGNYNVSGGFGGGAVVVVDDARAARATKVSLLPAQEQTQAGAAPTRSPPGCAIGGAPAGAGLGVLLFAVGRRRGRGR